ncbi:MAG: hypothetical protein WBO36_03345 [Saprospiraceae bacterium]
MPILSRNLLISLIFIPVVLFGQVNIKVGYIGGFTKAPVLNEVVSDFGKRFLTNHPTGKMDDALDQFRSLHGLEIGLRYKLSNVGFELSWHNMSDKSDVFATLTDKTNFSDKWYLSLTQYSFGIENYFGHLGYGASLGYRTARMKTEISGAPRKKRTVTNESGYSSKFYLIFQFPSEKVGIAFKPYVEVPLKNIDISSFDQELNDQLYPSYRAITPQEERFFLYGISIVLYNGRQ